MKNRSGSIVRSVAAACGVSLLCLASCKDKGKQEEAVVPAAEPGAVVEPEVPDTTSSNNSQRTLAFGFLSRMPAETEGAIGLRNFSDVFSGVAKSNSLKRAMTMLGGFAGDSDPQGMEQAQILIDQWVGKELFVAFAKGSAEKFAHLRVVSELVNQGTYASLGLQIVGGTDDPEAMLEGIRKQLKLGLADEGSELSKALEGFEIPPMIIGSKVTEGAEGVIAQLAQFEQTLPPVVVVSEFKVGAAAFKSWSVNIRDVFTEAQVTELNEFLQDEKASARLAEIIRKKKVEFSFGVIDNYLVFGLGTDHKHLQFVSKPEESVLATESFEFADPFLAKKLMGYAFMSKAMLAASDQAGQVRAMADSLAAGFSSGSPAMAKLGGMVKQLGAQLAKFAQRGSEPYVGIAYMDKGIHWESTGGYTNPMSDGKARSQFANVAPQDAALVISSVAKPEFRGDSIAMMETMFSGVEIGVEVWAEKSGTPSSLEQFKEMKGVMGENLTKIWGILKGKFLDGLGSQSGIIVDLKGTMPKGIPNMPRVLADQGKVPRIALASDVSDRAKLAEAWKELVPTLNETLASIPGQQPGGEVQVPDVATSEGDALVTHYFSLPFISNDFMPSISLNDDLFFLSTSKNFSESLAAGAKGAEGDIRGFYMMMNFSELNRFAGDWFKLVSENAEQVLGDPASVERFKESSPQMQFVLELTRGIKGFKYNRYVDDAGDWRSSWYLHAEDIE